MKREKIFCDVYGTNVLNSQCTKCELQRACIKIKLNELGKKRLMRSNYPEQSTLIVKDY